MKAALVRLRGRLTFANVTAATALFVALGGTSYAAISLPRNSVGAEQIRTGASVQGATPSVTAGWDDRGRTRSDTEGPCTTWPGACGGASASRT